MSTYMFKQNTILTPTNQPYNPITELSSEIGINVIPDKIITPENVESTKEQSFEKPQCSHNLCGPLQTPKQCEKYFALSKLFSELDTDQKKLIARKNLGIDQIKTGSWGSINGDIEDQEDLINYISQLTDIYSGIQSINTIDELSLIPSQQVRDGMLVYIKSLDIYYTYKQNTWLPSELNSYGIPIYTEDRVESLPVRPTDYILIRNQNLNKSIENKIYNTSFDGTYMDILFSALRSLQSEVAKLKNSFKYGISSYTETATAMSNVLGEITTPDDEPLWAIEEDSLSEFLPCTVSMDYLHTLQGPHIVADNENSLLTITGDATFYDPDDGFKVQPDSKILVYLTMSKLSSKIHLVGSDKSSLEINLRDLVSVQLDVYNVLIVVSKKTQKISNDNTLYGKNYVWIQITDPKSNLVITSGYYTGSFLTNNLFELNTQYYISAISFTDLVLSKFNSYTKAQDFTNEVIPTYPTEDEYKFNVAHLTIRSVSTKQILDKIQNQLLENELIWLEEHRQLCIKSKGKIFTIGGTSINDDTIMTTEELIASLRNLGITVTGTDTNYNIQLANLIGITFIHEDTNKKFEISVDSNGQLRSTPIDTNYLSDRVSKVNIDNLDVFRGFISKLRLAEKLNEDPTTSVNADVGLLSDRLKIGAVYAPIKNREIYSCSHAYIELENTSDQDINLKGCYLHVIYQEKTKEIYSLPLTGVIKAGSTYLIRGKQYAEFNDANTVIKVDTFDQEWYINGELIDLQRDELNFILLYDIPTVNAETEYINIASSVINSYYIDGICMRGNTLSKWIHEGEFTITDSGVVRDYVLKNTFELDPAKQAFQAINSKDSSRVRGANKNDFKPFYIDQAVISFPNSDPTYDVSLITPKASFQNKNVSTDKTKLDRNKPNMVYCSFGIDIHSTRCFNWISVGFFDEYIWIRKKGESTWKRFESYKNIDSENIADSSQSIYRKEFSVNINNSVYARMTGRFPGDGSFYTAHKCILQFTTPSIKTEYEYCVGRALITGEFDPEHVSNIQTFIAYPYGSKANIYHITDQQGFYWIEYQTWAGSAKEISRKIVEDQSSGDFIPIIINTGDVTQNGTRVNEWLDYYLAGYDLFKQYEHMSVVGNNDLCGTDPSILGTGDDIGKSNGYYHHLFNCYEIDTEALIVNGKYIPSTYYFEYKDSQGKTDVRIVNMNSELTFINCRDWFGLKVSDNVAYNIYTGWTTGNVESVTTPEYQNNLFTPIYNTLYTWLSGVKCIVACHEIPFTVMTKENLSLSNDATLHYTDYSRSLDGKSGALVGSHLNQITKVDNTCLYWFSRLLEHSGVKLVLGGHKHTYTCTYPVKEFYFYYDILDDGSRDTILKNSYTHGSMQMKPDLSKEYDATSGHLTQWVFTKVDDSLFTTNTSATFSEGVVYMPDNVQFHTSRLPIVKFSGTMMKTTPDGKSQSTYDEAELGSRYLPIIAKPSMNDGIIYFMCQATGYKQTSNKELPGTSQAFTMLLPLTTYNATTQKDTASAEQQVPMFAVVELSDGQAALKLYRIMNIQSSKKKPLYNNFGEYGTSDPYLDYIDASNSRFGTWFAETQSTNHTLVNITL